MTENRKQTFAQQAILNRVAEKNAAVTKMRAYNEEYGQYNECGVPAYNELHGDYSEFAYTPKQNNNFKRSFVQKYR